MWLIRYVRLIQAFAHAYWMVWMVFPHLSQAQKFAAIQVWSRKVLDVMGVELLHDPMDPSCTRSSTPMLWVANHVSWLDILVIQAIHPCVFVAKSEVLHWPVLGTLAKACDVIFVNRQSATGTRQMVHQVNRVLSQGHCVAAFPEGTTSEGQTVRLFHANLFETVVQHRLPVQPIALHYSDLRTGVGCPQVAYVDDMGFISSLHQVMTTAGIRASVRFGEQLSAMGHSRRTLAMLSHQSVCTHLRALQQARPMCHTTVTLDR